PARFVSVAGDAAAQTGPTGCLNAGIFQFERAHFAVVEQASRVEIERGARLAIGPKRGESADPARDVGGGHGFGPDSGPPAFRDPYFRVARGIQRNRALLLA